MQRSQHFLLVVGHAKVLEEEEVELRARGCHRRRCGAQQLLRQGQQLREELQHHALAGGASGRHDTNARLVFRTLKCLLISQALQGPAKQQASRPPQPLPSLIRNPYPPRAPQCSSAASQAPHAPLQTCDAAALRLACAGCRPGSAV